MQHVGCNTSRIPETYLATVFFVYISPIEADSPMQFCGIQDTTHGVQNLVHVIHAQYFSKVIPSCSQRDAMFLDLFYFDRRSTCFRRLLRPSSGAHNCTYCFRYCQPILLLAAIVDEMEIRSISSTIAASNSIV